MKQDIEEFASSNLGFILYHIGLPREQIDNMSRKEFEALKIKIHESMDDYRRRLEAQVKADVANLFRGYNIRIN